MSRNSFLKGTPLTDIEHTFLSELVASGSKFIIVGMSAADLQGANIGTQDLDLWFESTSDGGLDRAARSVGSMFAWRANPPALTGEQLERIDIVNRCHGLGSFDREYDNALDMEVEGLSFKVLPLDRVIASKKAANRPKDRAVLPTLKATLAANRYYIGGCDLILKK
jgi:predicted nucleotidyltransferase